MENENQKILVSMIIKNVEGVLSKISNDCFENDINIERLTISEFQSSKNKNQKAIMLLQSNKKQVETLLKNLKKKKLVSSYYIFDPYSSIERELMMIKVDSKNSKYEKLVAIFNEYKVENIYSSQGNQMVFQFSGSEIRNNELMSRLEKITDEIEILKSGIVAITINEDMKN